MSPSQSNQSVDLALAIAHLRSHNLSSLFQTLGWDLSTQDLSMRSEHTYRSQRCTPIAHSPDTSCGRITVWQTVVSSQIQLTPDLERSLYDEIAAREPHCAYPPIVIFTDAKQTRSLWRFDRTESALYVSGHASSQLAAFWLPRLKQLSQLPYGLAAAGGSSEDVIAQCERFSQLVKSLRNAIAGMGNGEDRDSYALLTLQRLIFIQGMQRKGWLNGDIWYLQNRFGKAVQEGGDRFFSACLRPLYRSLALPEIERPLALVEQTENVPFLERVFDRHPLEEKYETISITNQPFEDILGWLSEQSNSDTLNPFGDYKLSKWLAWYWQKKGLQSEDSPTALYVNEQLRSLSLDTFLKQKVLATSAHLFDSQQFKSATLSNLLFNASMGVCRHLAQDVLPALRVLDPACGSGSLLLAMNLHLVELSAILADLQHSQDSQLKIWRSELGLELGSDLGSDPESQEMPEQFIAGPTKALTESRQASWLLSLQKQVLKNNLYGVDITEGAVGTAKFQLLLVMLAIAQQPQDLNPLPDLSLTILTGNSLIGFIQVDENRFDQVNTAGEDSVLQGNLLQPLAADGYKTTLAEKNLAIEHYKSRNQALAEASSIPVYARTSLLREEIVQLDINAQAKLNSLLLNYMSEQLSIQYKAMQLTDKPLRRLLTAEDVDILQPFHWGYHFSDIIEQGGFDVIACVPPQGAFKPTAEEFVQRFQDIAVTKGIEAVSLKTSKQALSEADPEVACAWMFYQDTYAYTSDYFYRSEQFTYQNSVLKGKVVRNQLIKERLFVERCMNLLAPDGVGAIALGRRLSEDARSQRLWQHLQNASDCEERSLSPNVDGGDHIVLSIHKRAYNRT